ncbi:MAG: hypothetical protein M0Z50_05700 [Planctomycetia bacterium]|nr:hypothetical protein [Planctomycetia bacterium]
MNLKKLLHGDDQQFLTSKDYRVASQLRIRSGQALAVFAPLVALGAVINSPFLMIPGLYVPTAIALPPLAEKAHKILTASSVPFVMALWLGLALIAQLAHSTVVTVAGAKHFWRDVSTLAAVFAGTGIYEKFFVHYSWSHRHNAGILRHQLHFQSHYGWTLIVAGLAMTGICAWLSFTLMKGRRTQSMQRIAQHLAIQEAENA